MLQFGLTGNPLGHSMSRIIHEKLFQIRQADCSYQLCPAEDVHQQFRAQLCKLDGFNITVPHKTEIISELDGADERVRLYGACNTAVRRPDGWYGYNTDADGFWRTMQKCGVSVEGKRVLITGAGGVARMMAFETVMAGAHVCLLARNREKSLKIADEIAEKLNKTIDITTETGAGDTFDILLQGTPSGMYPKELALPAPFFNLKNIPFVFDTIYNPKQTLLTRLAAYCGNRGENGLYMLVAQAAAAQMHFCGLQYTAEELEQVASEIEIQPFCMDQNVILIGPPGSGKTTAGAGLARILNLEYVDIDACIEAEQHRTIPEIFKQSGEACFRTLEQEAVRRRAMGRGQCISTGGGMVENEAVMRQLLADENNLILFLDISRDILLNRVQSSTGRPLLQGDAEARLNALLNRRMPLYRQYSNVRLHVAYEQPKEHTVIQCIDKLCGFDV